MKSENINYQETGSRTYRGFARFWGLGGGGGDAFGLLPHSEGVELGAVFVLGGGDAALLLCDLPPA